MPTKPNTSDKPAADKRLQFSIPHTFKVDRAAGVLSDLQLMACNREAKGHGIYIDAATLETAAQVIAGKGGRLKGYATHNHGGPGTWFWEQDKSELDVAGFFSSIAVAKEQLVAGRFEFFDTYKAASANEYARMMEMAEKTPELLGLSVEMWGYVVYVGTDGTEYSQRPEDIDLANEGMPTFRVTEMWAAAFVSDGAVTDGLFASLGAKGAGSLLKKLAAAIGLGGGEETPVASPATNILPASKNSPANPTEISAMSDLIKSIKAKFGADKALFSQAMTILGDKPEITFAALEVEMVNVSLAAAQAEVTSLKTQVTTLTSEVTTLKTQLGAAQKERDDFKLKFETVKRSGHTGVNLSAPAAANFDGPNPFAKESLNLSQQALLVKADPVRAAALKEAAAAGATVEPAKSA